MTDRLEYRFNNALNAIRKQKANDFLCSLNNVDMNTIFHLQYAHAIFLWLWSMVYIFVCFKAHCQPYYVRRTSTNRPIPFTRRDMWKMCTVQRKKRMNLSHMEKKSTTTAQVKRRKIIKIAHYIMERTLRETMEVHVFKMIAIRQCRAFECFVYNTFFLFAYAKQNAISKCDYLFAWIFVDALLLCLFIASDSIR